MKSNEPRKRPQVFLSCCVPWCVSTSRYNSVTSFHGFPPGPPELRAQWLKSIRRESFKPSQTSRVCSRHFRASEIIVRSSGGKRIRKGAVPSLFPWNKYCGDIPAVLNHIARDHDYCATPINNSTPLDEKSQKEAQETQNQLEHCGPPSRFGLERLAGSDEDIKYYTRFASYELFKSFWALLQPSLKSKMVQIRTSCTLPVNCKEPIQQRPKKLAPVDELLLFLMHLSLGLPPEDLAQRFDIHPTKASRLITIWTRVLYHVLGSVCLWISAEEVLGRLPLDFSSFPDTHVVLSFMEISCQSPSSLGFPSDQCEGNKVGTTFRAMIGTAPHGPITFVSSLYAGSISNKEIYKLSKISSILSPHMAIMAGSGFPEDINEPCRVYRLDSLTKNSNMIKEEDQQMPFPITLRDHVDRGVRWVRENKLFEEVIPLSACGSLDQLFSVACFLVNYQKVSPFESMA